MIREWLIEDSKLPLVRGKKDKKSRKVRDESVDESPFSSTRKERRRMPAALVYRKYTDKHKGPFEFQRVRKNDSKGDT